MAGATNIGNDAIAELCHDEVDSTTSALPEESPDSGMSTASTGGRSTGVDYRSNLGDEATPESPVAPSSRLSTQSSNTQGFLLTGIGGLGFPDAGLRAGVGPEYPHTIQDELLTTEDVGQRHLEQRFSSAEDPWSGVDFCVPENTLRGLVPIFWSRGGCLTTQTQLLIKHLFDSNRTGCADHVESNCVHPHEQRSITQRVSEALYAIFAVVSIMVMFTLQAHGLQLTWMIIYGLLLLLAAVLVVMRMLL
ncbi:hypothetical protein MMC30_002619 [Trapelia coarctata]|nr:hypothetical protein [Trapelia coarctata]